jgi:hypothetical protein
MRPIGRLALLALCAMLASGCATRGRLAIQCDRFVDYVHVLPYSRIEADIRNSRPGGQADAEAATARAAQSVMARPQTKVAPPTLAEALAEGWRRRDARIQARTTRSGAEMAPRMRDAVARAETPSVLLLSGGGQWGAFGAGLLNTLAADNPDEYPNPVVITGVSTGALQMLFVGAGLEDETVRAALRTAYSPKHEREVVNRQPQLLAVFSGSISGLKPLKKRIENALCPQDDLKRGHCPMLEKLGKSAVVMRAGFVEARSGLFEYADINGMARSAMSPREKRSCIAGAALASVAMPVFFQQVSVDGTTYFDGGVRQSVFAGDALRELKTQPGQRGELPVFVLRNGPTDVEIDETADGRLNALDAALRAERIVVNQVEVSSVAALRLDDPYGYLGFASADGWFDQRDPADPDRTCGAIKSDSKNRNAQFVPAFMQCLMDYGARRARREATVQPPGSSPDQSPRPVWTPISNIGAPRQPPPLPEPANDN